MLKKFAVLLIVVLAATCVYAQTADVYYVNYFSNRNNTAGWDATVRVVNPGMAGTPISANAGTLCADIYVFDAYQEMVECCSCPLSANSLRVMSVNGSLVSNPLTNIVPNDGVIKIVSSAANGTSCAGTELQPTPTPNLRAWATHVQKPTSTLLLLTEDEFQESPLSSDELGFLGNACSFVQYLGSGEGRCFCGYGD